MLVRKDDQRLKYLDQKNFKWEEITEDEYHNFLDMLPPIFQTRLSFFRELSQIVWEVNSLIIGVVVFGLLVKFALWGYKESKNG